jgi:hypothetical protein
MRANTNLPVCCGQIMHKREHHTPYNRQVNCADDMNSSDQSSTDTGELSNVYFNNSTGKYRLHE